MRVLVGILGLSLLLIVLWDAFETIVLPRRVTRKFRLARMFYRSTWRPWSAAARWMKPGSRRETYLSFFGPLSLLLLLVVWAAGLILSFGLLNWSLGSPVRVSEGSPNLGVDFYLSGSNFFTLGLGDATPLGPAARVLAVVEAGMGFGFLAIVIGYLPVIYQAFSRREVSISLLDARAGSPPSAAELLRRHAYKHGMAALQQLLHDWEHWSAELLESHLSYPVLAYYRSQHNNQSWLAALTTLLDTSALVITSVEGACQRQAELTFAIARHAVVDLAQVFNAPPRTPGHDRLPPEELARLRADLATAGLQLRDGEAVDRNMTELRHLYEPYVNALSQRLLMPLPPWIGQARRSDNWQTSAWGRTSREPVADRTSGADDEHF